MDIAIAAATATVEEVQRLIFDSEARTIRFTAKMAAYTLVGIYAGNQNASDGIVKLLKEAQGKALEEIDR